MRRALLGVFVFVLGFGACNQTRETHELQPVHKGPGTPVSAAPADGGAHTPAAASPHVVLAPDGHAPVTVAVEVARTEGQRRRGLMYRQYLAPETGMLFLFDHDQVLTFWMRNTLIPLDMIFIKADLTVAGVVENAKPLTDDTRTIGKPSRYVLEVNAGFARAHGIGAGTHVRFENVSGRDETAPHDREDKNE